MKVADQKVCGGFAVEIEYERSSMTGTLEDIDGLAVQKKKCGATAYREIVRGEGERARGVHEWDLGCVD